MSAENPLWGAPRIHGELLKLGFEVAQASVAKYMVRRCGPASQGWRTFLRNHAPDIAAMDLFIVPTIGFDLLYVIVIVRLARRDLVWVNVTPHPTAEWVARQITEAFPWNEAPRYLIRDRDRVYGAAVMHRLRAMGIRDKPIAPGSPWQNGFAGGRPCGPFARPTSVSVRRAQPPARAEPAGRCCKPRLIIPILNLARAMPMMRTILPPIEPCWWPNTCSTRARTFERVVFADRSLMEHCRDDREHQCHHAGDPQYVARRRLLSHAGI